jgi:four helix bundle protein
VQDFHQLDIWQKAHALVIKVYRASNDLPDSENFGLVLHLRRSAMSVPRCIAEGCGREGNTEFAVDLRRARAALFELEYLLLLCHDLGFYPEPLFQRLTADVVEVRKMISGLLKRMTTPAETLR